MKKIIQSLLLIVLVSSLFSGLAIAEETKENQGFCIIRISNKKDADLRACTVHGQNPEGQACHKKATDEYDAALAECHKLPKS